MILEATISLVMGERKSFMPLTYIALICMAYFGPNANLLGNIQLRIWQYQRPIEDIEQYITNVSLFLAMDFASFTINGILLWNLAKINVLKVMNKIQEEFWIMFAIAEAFHLMEVQTWAAYWKI